MEIIYEMGDDILIAELYGEMDHHSSEKIRHDIDEMLDLYGMHHLIMDFSRVGFMDSAGIGVVLSKYRRIKAFGGHVSICGANDRILRIMRMSGIGQIVTFYPTTGQALEAKR